MKSFRVVVACCFVALLMNRAFSQAQPPKYHLPTAEEDRDKKEIARIAQSESPTQADLRKLVRFFKHESPFFRASALGAAGGLFEQAGPILPDIIAELDSTDIFTLRSAILALGKLGPMSAPAVPKLIKLMNYKAPDTTPPDERNGDTWGVHAIAAWALGRIGPQASDAATLLCGNGYFTAMGRIGVNEKALDALLVAARRDKDKGGWLLVIGNLYGSRDPDNLLQKKAIPALREMSKDWQGNAKKDADWALDALAGKYGDRDVIGKHLDKREKFICYFQIKHHPSGKGMLSLESFDLNHKHVADVPFSGEDKIKQGQWVEIDAHLSETWLAWPTWGYMQAMFQPWREFRIYDVKVIKRPKGIEIYEDRKKPSLGGGSSSRQSAAQE